MQQAVVVSDPHIASEVLLNVPGIQKSDIVKVLDLVLSGSGHSSLLTASTQCALASGQESSRPQHFPPPTSGVHTLTTVAVGLTTSDSCMLPGDS